MELPQDISDYFTTNNIDTVSFLRKYIQVDRIIGMSWKTSDTELSQQLESLKLIMHNQTKHLDHLSGNIIETLKNVTNNDLKAALNEHLGILQQVFAQTNDPNIIKDALQTFQEKIKILNSEQLNDLDRKSIGMLSTLQSNLLKDISTTLDSHTIHHKVSAIHDTLTQLHNNFTGNSSNKGKFTENVLFTNLTKAFPDSDVALTRDQSESCDIQVSRDGRPTILIDSKHCEASNVRKSDLEKFYDDCQLNNACGILCNAFGGIANRSNFEIDIKDKRVYVFVSNHQFDPEIFQLAARVIYNVYDVIKDQSTDCINVDQQLYQRLKIEYNFFLHSFQQHLDNIRQNVNSLSQLTLTQLDHFFKRTSLHSDTQKAFSCQLCGTGFGTTKALKKHLKEKHEINMTAGRSKKDQPDQPMQDA